MKTLLLAMLLILGGCGSINQTCDLNVPGQFYYATWSLAPESTQATNDPTLPNGGEHVPCSVHLPKDGIIMADKNFTEVPTATTSPVVYPDGYRYLVLTDDMCYRQIKQVPFLGCVFQADLERVAYPASACMIRDVVANGMEDLSCEPPPDPNCAKYVQGVCP